MARAAPTAAPTAAPPAAPPAGPWTMIRAMRTVGASTRLDNGVLVQPPLFGDRTTMSINVHLDAYQPSNQALAFRGDGSEW
ncbi:hypothetical protein HYALB_00005183 [Hymenoscyphus albidus]|uniref:Uncharacterized protein n=1 Tax=Hymenoscyphus albidus TaxID=595503 RepID=A0A9N9Q514_9HELO|nr:hypothetical protein HYALB_00005183 [Hymenoscyphus albidus]